MSQKRLELAKQEYIKLKDEQAKRIGFRDNLLYVNLVLISGVISFAFAGEHGANRWRFHGLLLAAWAALVLGWTYVTNDEKISAIGRYLRNTLSRDLDPNEPEKLFGWEIAHRSDVRRTRRKLEQLVIDELSFPGIGLGSVILFFALSYPGPLAVFVATLEAILLVILGIEIFLYADLSGDSDIR